MVKHPKTGKDFNSAPTANQSLFEGTIVDYAVKNAHRARLDFRYLMAPLYGTGYSADKHHDQHKKRGCRAVGGIFGGTKALSEFVQGTTPVSPIRVVEIDDGDFQLMDTNVLTGAVPADAELLVAAGLSVSDLNPALHARMTPGVGERAGLKGPFAFWSIVGDFYGTDGVVGVDLFSRVAGYLKHLNKVAKPSPSRSPSPSYAEYHAAHAARVMREEAAKAVQGPNPRLQAMGQAYLSSQNSGVGYVLLKGVFDAKRDRDDFEDCLAVIGELRRELPKADSLFAVGVLDTDWLFTLGTVERDVVSGCYASADAAINDARAVLREAPAAAAKFDDMLAAAVDRRPAKRARVAPAEGAAPRPRAGSGLSAAQIDAAVMSQPAVAIAFGDRIAALRPLVAAGDGEPGAAAPVDGDAPMADAPAADVAPPGALWTPLQKLQLEHAVRLLGLEASAAQLRALVPSRSLASVGNRLKEMRAASDKDAFLGKDLTSIIGVGAVGDTRNYAGELAAAAARGAAPPRFVVKLIEMIKQTGVICFEGGDIIIPSTEALEKRLGDYYSGAKYASFTKQLNNFGYQADGKGDGVRYRKVTGGETVTTVEDLLSLRPLPRRKSPPAGSASAPVAAAPKTTPRDGLVPAAEVLKMQEQLLKLQSEMAALKRQVGADAPSSESSSAAASDDDDDEAMPPPPAPDADGARPPRKPLAKFRFVVRRRDATPAARTVGVAHSPSSDSLPTECVSLNGSSPPSPTKRKAP
ncbi:hypothetical protein AURANDRAFT_67207 [Aureococcus anophagefferens]|uniref:HSF-type DNA-binding domain-containing protein n=1 Tax=Aureococcus anophagefferens TaxID=44056 RepID=F0YK61_AURAN|nr:hypothetical protein AURANDRAFT_67207 [Aureococcus anophagefferens]EGB04444.1 hypothetical protein AURANDRAFT_67207 [Aureococcus anophagefferens]|eukprot:XP_009040831.1 hypothetical protein AURANDRAFT_67207 [Aureococcus anophagefferens]